MAAAGSDNLVFVRDSRGFTLIELLVVILILGILLTIGMANYRHARIRGAEVATIGALSAINQAQFAFMQTCGRQKFAPKLSSLGKVNPNSGTAYLSPDLTGGEEVDKSGYRISMGGTEVSDVVQTCTGETPLEGYSVTADPIVVGTTGIRHFGTNLDLTIYESPESLKGKIPERGSPEIGQEVKGLTR